MNKCSMPELGISSIQKFGAKPLSATVSNMEAYSLGPDYLIQSCADGDEQAVSTGPDIIDVLDFDSIDLCFAPWE